MPDPDLRISDGFGLKPRTGISLALGSTYELAGDAVENGGLIQRGLDARGLVLEPMGRYVIVPVIPSPIVEISTTRFAAIR